MFPGRGKTIWRWLLNGSTGTNTTLSAPLGHINVHDGAVLLLHQAPAHTTVETLSRPFVLLVTQSASGHAFGAVYLDDSVSNPPAPCTTIT
ncbi:hypothetical protein B0H11DRAFT_1761913, partial [Mycena galericulata]